MIKRKAPRYCWGLLVGSCPCSVICGRACHDSLLGIDYLEPFHRPPLRSITGWNNDTLDSCSRPEQQAKYSGELPNSKVQGFTLGGYRIRVPISFCVSFRYRCGHEFFVCTKWWMRMVRPGRPLVWRGCWCARGEQGLHRWWYVCLRHNGCHWWRRCRELRLVGFSLFSPSESRLVTRHRSLPRRLPLLFCLHHVSFTWLMDVLLAQLLRKMVVIATQSPLEDFVVIWDVLHSVTEKNKKPREREAELLVGAG